MPLGKPYRPEAETERPSLKSLYIYAAILGASLTLNSESAYAQKFDSRIGNPFVFCSLPKPCKLCQPFRAIHENICAGQSGASKEEAPDQVQPVPLVMPGSPVPIKDSESESTEERAKQRGNVDVKTM